jgi:hypothetical protein
LSTEIKKSLSVRGAHIIPCPVYARLGLAGLRSGRLNSRCTWNASYFCSMFGRKNTYRRIFLLQLSSRYAREETNLYVRVSRTHRNPTTVVLVSRSQPPCTDINQRNAHVHQRAVHLDRRFGRRIGGYRPSNGQRTRAWCSCNGWSLPRIHQSCAASAGSRCCR